MRCAGTAPRGYRARGRIVCHCVDVAERQIADAFATTPGPAEAALASVQSQLRCGTQCGSCLPELKRMVRSQPVQAI